MRLVHYDPSLPIKMAGDAYAYGVGAVMSHVMPDGSERPIAFASLTVTVALVWVQYYRRLGADFWVKKFHIYLYGRSFTIVTDCKLLTTILGPKKGILPWQRLTCNAGWCYYRHTITRLNSSRHSRMEMPMACPL